MSENATNLLPGILQRKPRALARAVTILERGGPEARDLVERLHGEIGDGEGARVLGITGPPGAGKSSLVDRLARLLRERGETVAILAVDPSSPFSGGALLGDRVRMQALYTDPGVFIRSMATRGALGGLSRATHDAVDLLSAAGFDRVILETVGVGQDEVDVVTAADVVVVVTVPGLGDSVQAIKAGLLEIADVFAVNKADRDGVEAVRRDLELMLRAEDGAPSEEDETPIIETVATEGKGVAELLEMVDAHRDRLAARGDLDRRRRDRLALRVEHVLVDRVLASARRNGLDRIVDEGHAQGKGPYELAERLWSRAVNDEETT